MKNTVLIKMLAIVLAISLAGCSGSDSTPETSPTPDVEISNSVVETLPTPSTDPIEENKIETYTAITSVIDEWLYELGFFEKEEINSLYYETEIEEYLKGVQKILKK